MSAWVEGKLDLRCSIDVLKKAIINIMPEWEKHLMVDEKGEIPMYRYNGQREYNGSGGDKNVHIVIPGSGHPGVKTPPGRNAHNDWGFKRNEDGKWEVTYADYGLYEAKDLENKIKGEIALMKAKAIAKIKGFEIVGQNENEDEKYIDVKINTNQYEQLI